MTASLRPLLLIALLLCSACNKNDSAVPTEKPAIAVETAIAAPALLTDAIHVTGTLAARNAAEIKSELAGLYTEVYVTEWVAVRKGQPLARIQAAETATLVKRAEAGALQARVEADRVQREAGRMEKLKGAGLATQQQLDDALSMAAAADALRQAAAEELAQLRLRLEKSLIRAPIDGVVAMRAVNVGDLAGADSGGNVIFRIVDNRILDLTVTVPSTDFGRVAVGQLLDFSCDGLPGRTFSGTIKYLNPSVNPADRSLQLMAEIDNRDGRLRDGLFVKGEILIGQRENVLLVPRTVLSGLDLAAGSAVLFVVNGDQAERRAVSIGTLSGDHVEIVSGLQAGEYYVSRGAFNLSDGDKVSVATVKQP
ncbi:MAG: efflux RND transporter periplasmic adaptor subunit [Deltaproteobacteria bacterium HGW-Deltaproteobacteria-4]|nr:MAG: efflux RND transporter periplasmic adaptor subunit [Deltaproteobacteria bacterium HGW-Deltaproteobacteria-4]